MNLSRALIIGVTVMLVGSANAESHDTPLTQHHVVVKTGKRGVVHTRHVTTHLGYTVEQRREREITADLNRHGVQVHPAGDDREYAR